MNIKVGENDEVVDLYEGDDLEDIRYGNWKPNKNGRYLLPAYLGGSDYSGSLVERSNHEKWQELFADGIDDWWGAVHGGHGTFAILIDVKNVPADIEDDVANFLNGLQDYPLADEDMHSQMETEAQGEAWANWAQEEFTRALEKKFDIDLSEVEERDISRLFEEVSDRTSTYWVNEQGDSMYIDIARIVKNIGLGDMEPLVKKE